MPLSIELAKESFSAGEVSAELRSRDDLQKNQTALWFLENMVVLLEGGVTRRPGTRMIMPMKDPSRISAAIPFRFDGTASNAYLIVFNAGVIRWILGNGVVQFAGVPYEVVHPYSDADLGGAGAVKAGVSNLRATANGNVIFLFCDGHQTQTLTRNADNSWALAAYVPQGGPVDNINIDPTVTILASANTGNGITLTGTGTNFAAGNVGGVWRLDESDLSLIPEWLADETITVPTQAIPVRTGDIGDMANPANAWDGSTATGSTKTAAAGYQGAHYVGPQSVYQYRIRMTNTGFFQLASFFLYAKNGAAPANSTDGTQLAILQNFPAGSLGWDVTLTSNDFNSTWDYIWVTWGTTAADTKSINELNPIQFTSGGAAVYRRWNGNVYQALSGSNAGAEPPVHTKGDVLSQQGGVIWRYIHRDRGFVQITAVGSATSATANVLEVLPLSVTQRATTFFWPAAWDAVKGWPNRGRLAHNALLTARGGKFWRTQPGSFFNHDIVDPTDPSSGIEAQLVSGEGSRVNIEWFMQASYLVAGARDDEWVLAGQNPFAPISVQNLDPYASKNEGSAVHVPALCEGGTAFIGRSRDRLHHATVEFGGVSPQVLEEELTLTARHILKPGALGISHQRDPGRINWIWLSNGALVSETLMRPQQINGWARHPLVNGAIEWIVTIPSTDEGVSWTYLGTMRTINGVTARFVELLQPFFGLNAPMADASGAWYVDCGLQYVGPPVTVITGLDHLNGQAVNVHADGAMYFKPDGTLPVVGPVTGGIGLVLSRPTQNCIVGLPINYRVRLLPFDFSDQQGATEGKRARANHFFVTVVNSAGGKIAGNPDAGGKAEAIEALGTTGALSYGSPVPLVTNTVRTQGILVPLDDQCVVEITGSDTMPFTLTGVDPDVDLTENA